MLVSIVTLLFINPSLVVRSLMDASSSAVSLCINLIGIYAVWLGLIEVLNKSGLSDKLAHLLKKPIKFLFKSNNEEANKYIAINLASNILGLGNAATPSGIKAMQALDDKSGKANFSVIMLLVINSVSIQLLPTTIIGLRENADSANSTDIILPIIISSIATCTFAVTLTFLFAFIKQKITSKCSKKTLKTNQKVQKNKNDAFKTDETGYKNENLNTNQKVKKNEKSGFKVFNKIQKNQKDNFSQKNEKRERKV